MSAKGRDNRNHILRGGESQRKDGRYDNAGNAKYVYSWKLVQRIINNCYIKPMPLPLH